MNEKERHYDNNNWWKWAFIITFIILLASILGYCQSIQHRFDNTKIYQKLHKKNNETGFYEEIKEDSDISVDKDGKKLSNYMIELPSDKYHIVYKVTPSQLARRWHCPIDQFYASNPNLDPNNDQASNPTEPSKPIDETTVNVPNDNQTSALTEVEKQIINLTNQARVKQGLKPLKFDDQNLNKSARSKSIDMLNNNYFDHTSKTYGSPFDMMKQFGVKYISAGENIAKNQANAQEVVNAWLNSSGHRANIMNPNFTHIGVGASFGKNDKLYTQQFIQK